MGSISIYWTNGSAPPSLNLVPSWGEPIVQGISLPSDREVSLSIGISAQGYIFLDGIQDYWIPQGSAPLNGIGEWYECRVTVLPPSNGQLQGTLGGDFVANTWTPLVPRSRDGYQIFCQLPPGALSNSYINVQVELRRRTNGAILSTRIYRNLLAYNPGLGG